tara:strand:- start:14200 stop:15132 length:933 start_codon:yes stop_codon:yes gene_type:complete
MKITRHKSLVREIAPGIIVVGNNPFAPTLRLDELSSRAQLNNEDVLVKPDLTNISGDSLDYKNLHSISGSFETRPNVKGLDVMLSGDLDNQINDLINQDQNTISELNITSGILNETLENASGILNDKIIYESQVRFTKDDGLQHSIVLSSGILNDKIEEESLTRESSDQEINTKIDVLNQEVNDKITVASGDLQNSVDKISGQLEAETDYRTAMDNNLNLSIIEISGQLEAETDSRTTADNNLNLKIDEVSGRLDSESQTREDSINSLNLKVDNFSGEVDSKIEDLEQNALGISYAEAADLAKKWAIILG